MSVWLIVAIVAVASAALKLAPAIALGARELPVRLQSVTALLAPALLAALVVTQAVGDGQRVVVDARLGGLVAAALALALRAPVLVVAAVAAVAAASLRAFGLG